MRYDVEADWILYTTCNYRCTYCGLSEEELGAKVRIHATPDEWRAAFDATGKTWLLHMTGGEPSHFPGIAELCARVTERHYISINTNLTGRAMLDIADTVEPARVSFINAGLHAQERDRRNGYGLFLRHAEALLKRGFPLMVSVVATPEVLRDYEAIAARLAPLGIAPLPKLMEGQYAGQMYPQAYTAEERASFRRHLLAAERTYPSLLGGNRERPSIDPTLGRNYLTGLRSYRGEMCSAGQEFVFLSPAGRVARCGEGKKNMGNVLKRTLRLKTKATPCDRSYCFYFCEKYTARGHAQWAGRHPFAAIAKRVKRALVPAE